MTQTHLTRTRFQEFDLDPSILRGLEAAGFQYCTPIQARSLPIALAGRDVAGQAQTGTGKTAAFVIALLHHLLRKTPNPNRRHTQPRGLIIAPTRELAVQIHRDTRVLARYCGFQLGLVYGGTGYQKQRDALAAGVDILIGTPGRLIDYFKQHLFDLRALEVLVIDEADRLFDLGFIKDIRYLFRRMPPPSQRLGLLFSATLSYRVSELAYEHMNNPEAVTIEADRVVADQVSQCAYLVSNEEKIPLLIGLLRRFERARVMIFANTKRTTEIIWGFLEGNGFKAAILSGDVPQKKRLRLLAAFREGTLPILVATDVAARGLHIQGVTHVINYDLPEDPEDYVHRIGRTARAGAAGEAIGFVCETYALCLPDIEAFIGGKIPIAPLQNELLPPVDPESRIRIRRRRDSGVSDKRPRRTRRTQGKRAPKARAESGGTSSGSEPMKSDGEGSQGSRRRRRRKRSQDHRGGAEAPTPRSSPE